MPKKGVRTAVGFMETPRQEYMTPDYLRAGYVSYGGAGAAAWTCGLAQGEQLDLTRAIGGKAYKATVQREGCGCYARVTDSAEALEPWDLGSVHARLGNAGVPCRICETSVTSKMFADLRYMPSNLHLPSTTCLPLLCAFPPSSPLPAGFIYPAKAMSRASYGEGDTISCQLDFDAGRVTFFVNGQEAGGAPWRGAAEAYPAVSVFPGDLVCDVVLE